MTPDQCREARAILKWTRQELAVAAGVTLWVVAAFEDGREVLPFYESEIRAALEAVGIGFPFEIENGQFRPLGVPYSPRGRDEVN
jgi:DNA-binding XRE family transcriptional regulator